MEFLFPPVVRNARGEIRKAGFELEFAGIDLSESARIVREVFGGDERTISTFERAIETDAGVFSVEIDTAILKDKKYESIFRAVGLEPAEMDLQWLEELLLGT